MSASKVIVSAAANVALIKYWGKANTRGNQPATGSLSIGLDDLRTTTTLSFSASGSDTIHADLDEKSCQRLISFLDHARVTYRVDSHFEVTTHNNFPTGAGLASSASGFAAMAMAVDALLGLQLSPTDLTRLARTGSGSAARSVFDGYVEVVPEEDAYAAQIMPSNDWPMDVLVAVTDAGPKAIGSTEAMKITASTSDYYASWVESHADDIATAKAALAARDFEKLADVSEQSCLKMHATMMTSQPPILYWRPETLEIIERVRSLRAGGTPAFFTIDAGPQVKVVCLPEAAATVKDALDLKSVSQLIETKVGGQPTIQTA